MSKTDTSPDVEAVKEKWTSRGFSCEVESAPPGFVCRDFVHDTDELVMPLEGEIEIDLPNETTHLCRGEEFVVPGEVVHTLRAVGGGRSTWLYGYEREYAYTD